MQNNVTSNLILSSVIVQLVIFLVTSSQKRPSSHLLLKNSAKKITTQIHSVEEFILSYSKKLLTKRENVEK